MYVQILQDCRAPPSEAARAEQALQLRIPHCKQTFSVKRPGRKVSLASQCLMC